MGTNCIKKVAVVGNHQNRTLCLNQIILQKDDCLDIQVVCRFVKEEKFCIFYENLGEGNFFEHSA